jgi:hypothetical protein
VGTDAVMRTAVAVAKQAATRRSRSTGKETDWREFLGAAWEGANRCPHDDGRMTRSAQCALIDEYRAESGCGRKSRLYPHQFAEAEMRDEYRCTSELVPEPARAAPDTMAALLLVWHEERFARVAWPFKARVWLYLYAVEGWTMKEIAAAYGTVESNVSQSFRYYGIRKLGGHNPNDSRKKPAGRT